MAIQSELDKHVVRIWSRPNYLFVLMMEAFGFDEFPGDERDNTFLTYPGC